MTKEKTDRNIAATKKAQDIPDENPRAKACEDGEDIRARIAMLEAKRVSKATQEIQEILSKYGVVLEAVAIIPASQINIVPRPSR